MSKVSLRQLSEELNISVSTASKALRGSYDVSAETKKRVLETAQRLGYNPNPYAGSLRNNKSKTVALLVPELTNNFFIQAITGAESIAQDRDYHILIYNTNDDTIKEKSIVSDLQNGRVDGVIMSLASTTQTYDHLNGLIHSGIPIVFFDRICHEIETAKVTTDDFTSAFNATEHLIESGCKNLAFLSLSENLSIDNKRKQGYLEALNKYDIPPSRAHFVKCNGDEKSNHRRIKQFLQSISKPAGLFASVEKLALTAYYVCQDLKIEIPQDVKVICFSNLRTAPLLNPSLTTVTQPAFEMGKQAAQILFKYLDKKRTLIPNQNIIIKSELIERNSTKK